jgi:N-acetylglutamate synthase-like GNAT family acetyltransferase
LLAAGLPLDDLGPGKLDGFLVAEEDEATVGFAGLETFGTTGMLRSLVVDESVRSGGLGRRLVAAIEAAAVAAGIVELWLLTVDAERYFMRYGFEIVGRSLAPESIRTTDQFSALCPDNAPLMRKRLK